MLPFEQTLIDAMLLIELLAAIAGFLYFFQLKDSHWKWFCLYLIIMFVQEYFWFDKKTFAGISKQEFYAYCGIPIQYLFFYWLYGLKSLGNRKLFVVFSAIYIVTFLVIEILPQQLNIVHPVNLTVGTILLTILVIMEFKKQITLDNILEFKENKMFYINTGVIIFYIGTYPFFAFYDILREEDFRDIGDAYYMYYRISICLMYLLFTASFIWGKHRLK